MKRLLHKRITRKGFTLAELLIVVAILAILVAVSIPIFTSQLEKARKATDDANMRSAKALVAEAVLINDFPEESWTQTSNMLGVYYTACYDAEKGYLRNQSQGSLINGYGQGSTYTDKYGVLNNVYKGDIIYVSYFIPKGGEPQLELSWQDPSMF